MIAVASALTRTNRVITERAVTTRNIPARMPAPGPWQSCNTDPAQHNAKSNWRYLVHAIAEPVDLTEVIKERLEAAGVDATKCGSISPDFVSDSGTIQEMLRGKAAERTLCCTMIDNTHYGLWRSQGLILQIDADTEVLATGTKDLGSPSYSLALSRKRFANSKTLSPEQLLKETTGRWNEVLISGENPRGIHVLGVVVEVDDNGLGKPRTDYGAKLMEKAQREGLPIVFIEHYVKPSNL